MNNKDIVMMFPAYAGGKFISNCLCLSKHVVPPYMKFNFDKIENYFYRLDIVSRSLPPVNDINNWLYYEFDHDLVLESPKFYKTAKSLNLRCIGISHRFDINELTKWNNPDIVKLIRYEKFRHIAYSLKKTNRPFVDEDSQERYEQIKGLAWPTYEEFSSVGFDSRKLILDDLIKNEINQYYPIGSISIQTHLFDQSTIFNKQTFLNEMKKLYSTLDLDDFNEEATSIFYTKYATLHNI